MFAAPPSVTRLLRLPLAPSMQPGSDVANHLALAMLTLTST